MFQNFNEKLLLCMWCKAALRRAMALFKLALESENLNSKVCTYTSHLLTDPDLVIMGRKALLNKRKKNQIGPGLFEKSGTYIKKILIN